MIEKKRIIIRTILHTIIHDSDGLYLVTIPSNLRSAKLFVSKT